MAYFYLMLWATLCTVMVTRVGLVISHKESQYRQVYPQINDTDGRTPLYFALMLSFGGDYTSIGALPGVQIALDYINSHPSILPEYSLHYTLTDSECNRSRALESLFRQLSSKHIKLGLIGSGCSVATEPTAEITQFFNIPQISCVSSSSALKNRERFGHYFQLLAAEHQIVQGFFNIISNFGWKKIGIIIQNENLFTVAMDVLKQKLVDNGVNCTSKLFKTADGIGGISGQIFDEDTRIYVVAMYATHARDFLCRAYAEGIHYPKYMLITYGWYSNEWWKGNVTYSNYTCTEEERASVLAYSLAPRIQESYTNLTAVDESGITAEQFIKQYQELVEDEINEEINLTNFISPHSEPFYYAQHCYEAMLAFAYALDKTIIDLNTSTELNENATKMANQKNGKRFSIEHFFYNNSEIVEQMDTHLQNTSFRGLSGNMVQFDEDGIREIDVVVIYQYQWNTSNSSELLRVTLGVTGSAEYDELAINYTHIFPADNSGIWPDGVPNDGTPIEEVVTVSLGLAVVYMLLATAGIIFAVACLTFTLIFRRRKLIRLSSPNLNYIIGLGALVLYLNVITFVIPTTNQIFVSVLCNINPWLTSLGYSLCYGTILVKTVRIWFIFNKPREPTLSNSVRIKDCWLVLIVLCLVVIDVLILGTYTATEWRRGELGVKTIPNKENVEDVIGPTCEIHSYSLYICESNGQLTLFTVLFGYKGLLQVIALILAFSTRKVKVKGLDDSKYIAAAIYVTSIVLVVTTVSTYTLLDYVNIYPAVVGMGFLLGTTMILGLVFVPRMLGLYQDPEGNNIKMVNATPHKVPSRESGCTPDAEIQKLRRRICELERRSSQMGSTMSISNPDYLASSPYTMHSIGSERYHNPHLHMSSYAESHDSNRDNPLVEGKQSHRSVVRWSHDLSVCSPL